MAPTGRVRTPLGRREQVLQVLREVEQPLAIAQIADRLGVHVNTVRFHLDTLVVNGQVIGAKAKSSNGILGRPALMFQAVRGMDPMGPRDYRLLAGILISHLAGEPHPHHQAREAGLTWGLRHVAAPRDPIDHSGLGDPDKPGDPADSVKHLTTMLEEYGFAPEPSFEGVRSQIGLRHCPFLELAERSDVVCSVHLGLMQGAMQTWGAPVTVARLDPFVKSNLCMVHLSGT